MMGIYPRYTIRDDFACNNIFWHDHRNAIF